MKGIVENTRTAKDSQEDQRNDGAFKASSQDPSKQPWLANPATPAQVELRAALDEAKRRAADEVALRRVWARLAEVPVLVPSAESERDQAHEQLVEARARRGRWAWIVAASLAGATASLAFMLIETQSEFRAERTVPRVATSDADSANSGGAGTADQRSTLVAPATVRTGFGETLHLSLRGGTQVTVTSESTLVLDQNEHPAVSAGEVQFQVPHQAAGQTFAVTAANYRVVVVGTRFRVRVSESNAAVGVDEGVVEVWTDHRIARVAAGESWVGHTAIAPTLDTAPNLNRNNPAGAVQAPAAAVPLPRSKAPAASARVTGRRGTRSTIAPVRAAREVLALAAPTSAFAGAAAPSPTFVPAPAGATGFAASTAAATATTTATTKESSVTKAAPAEAPAPLAPAAIQADSAPLAIQARAARASGDTRRALGLYRALAERGGAAGENAEYEIGRLLRDGLHQPREAVSAWRSYRAQHPRGLLRIEADISVIETLTAAGDKLGAIVEAKDFMRRYPDSERRAEIARLAGDLLRERGECADAIAAYDVALGSAHGHKDVSDRAAYHRAVCLLRGDKGDRVEGTAALHAYVSNYPDGQFRIEAQRLLNSIDSADRQQLQLR